MIHGAHVILYSTDAEADRTFFRDVLKYPFVDAGHGWLIFALPPAEVAFHPSNENDVHELYLMCDDVNALILEMNARGVATAPLHEVRWGITTAITLPGGGKIGIYEPKHASPLTAGRARKGAAKRKVAKKAAAKKAPAKKVPAKKRSSPR